MVPTDHSSEDSIALVCPSRTMSTADVGRSPLSCGLILTMIACMLTASWAVAATPYSSSGEPVLLTEESEFSHAGARAAGDWVKAGVSDSSTQNGGTPTTSTSYTDSNGNTYLTGWILDSVAFDSTKSSTTAQLLYVAKIDASGNWVWVETGGNYGGGGFSISNDIVVDSSGAIFITGVYYGNASFGSHQLRSNADSNGDDTGDIFVAKMSSSGSWLWAVTAGGNYDSDSGNSIWYDGNGGAYVAGQFNISGTFGANGHGTNGDTDAFIAHIGSTGTWNWVAKGGGPGSDSADGVTTDSVGDLRVMGTFVTGTTQAAQFGSSSFNAVGSPDLFVSKISSSGSWVWTKTAGAPSGMTLPWGFDTEGTDSYVGGLFAGTANFGSHSITSGASDNNAFIAKIDGTGAWQWADASSGTGVQYVGSIDASPIGIAVSGGFSSGASTSATFGNTTLTGTYFEMLAGVLDSNGNWLWAKSGGSSGDDGYYNWGTGGVGWTPSGEVVAVGHACQGMSASCTATYGGNSVTVTPGFYNTNYGLAPAVVVWLQSSDSDGDGISDPSDNCPTVSNANQNDMDSDSIGDVCDPDIDEDGILNDDDACDGPAVNWDSSNWADDIDIDGCRDIDEDDDDDNDGVDDVDDGCSGTAYKLNWSAGVASDNDMDGCHDIDEDDDDDNDGIDDGSGDDCPGGSANWGTRVGPGDYTHNAARDHDSDGCEDDHAEDADDDNDGIDDVDGNMNQLDLCARGQLGWTSDFTLDADGDGCRDSDEDVDDDNDEVWDVDAFGNALDMCSPGMMNWISTDATDRDRDGCRDLDEDTDDDGDGVEDDVDDCFQEAMWTSDASTDHDGDGCRDIDEDLNDDNDPKFDHEDDCALGEVGWTDTDWDGDGCRDETEDPDDDDDGICDNDGSSPGICNSGPDLCPETPLGEDTNADGCGMQTQLDTDGDGVYDANDNCVTEPALDGYDGDLDGCTDDTDGDGVTDNLDVFPDEASQWSDRDGDTWGDNSSGNLPDQCQDTPLQWVLLAQDRFGCAWEEEDADSDGVMNGFDNCSDTAPGAEVDASGCSQMQIDDDGDGVFNALDDCADTSTSDKELDDSGCSHEQRLERGDTDAMLQEYGLIGGIALGVLLLVIVAMSVMLLRRGRKGGASEDDWVADEIQLAAQQQQQMAAPSAAAPAAVAQPQHVADYTGLPLGGDYVTDASGGTWYNAPDGSQWAMQADGSFVRAN